MANQTLNDEIKINGLKNSIEIIRDFQGVPHIYATNLNDLFFGFGYITAEDRLWQLEFYRRISAGTLSELFGKATLNSDIYYRNFGFSDIALENWKNFSSNTNKEIINVINSYFEGINEYIEKNSDNLPFEFNLLGFKPEKFEPEDSMLIVHAFTLGLSSNLAMEFYRNELKQKLGEYRLNEIITDNNESVATRSTINEKDQLINYLGKGSNNWVVSGKHSKSGKPLLANDPHVDVFIPSFFYMVHLNCPELNAIGATVPGFPVIVSGHNNHVAWGLTTSMADVQDLFELKINPKNRNQYLLNEKWINFTTKTEKFVIRNEDQIYEKEIKMSHFGPILDQYLSGYKPTLKENQVFSLKYIAHQKFEESPYNLILNFLKTKDVYQFREALKDFIYPSQNFVFADIDGNIAYQLVGKIPKNIISSSSEALIFENFHFNLVKKIILPKIGEQLFNDFYFWFNICFILKYPSNYWFGGPSNSIITNMRTIIAKVFKETVNELKDKFGSEISKWKWGDVHQLYLNHPLSMAIENKDFLNRGPIPIGGDSHTDNMAHFVPYLSGFNTTVAPTFRLIVDLGDLDNSEYVIMPGESGNPSNENYSDQIESWVKGKYYPLTTDKQKIIEMKKS